MTKAEVVKTGSTLGGIAFVSALSGVLLLSAGVFYALSQVMK